MVAGDAEQQLLEKARRRQHGASFDERLQCELGKEVPPNAVLRVTRVAQGKAAYLNLSVLDIEGGCQTQVVSAPWEADARAMAAEAVSKLLAKLKVERLQMPGAMAAKVAVEPVKAVGHMTVKATDIEKMPMFDGDADRFQKRANNAVGDRRLGLVWQRGDSGRDLDWAQAKDYCLHLLLAGRGGWRLPSIAELKSLVDMGREKSARIAAPFPSRKQYFWSESLDEYPYAWFIDFDSGAFMIFHVADAMRVRCVR